MIKYSIIGGAWMRREPSSNTWVALTAAELVPRAALVAMLVPGLGSIPFCGWVRAGIGTSVRLGCGECPGCKAAALLDQGGVEWRKV